MTESLAEDQQTGGAGEEELNDLETKLGNALRALSLNHAEIASLKHTHAELFRHNQELAAEKHELMRLVDHCGTEIERLKAESKLHLDAGARRAQELTHALSAAEQRARVAEQEAAKWKESHDVCCDSGQKLVEQCESKDAEVERLKGEVTILELQVSTHEMVNGMQVAFITKLRTVVEAAQAWRSAEQELTAHITACEFEPCDRCDELGGAECTAQAVMNRALADRMGEGERGAVKPTKWTCDCYRSEDNYAGVAHYVIADVQPGTLSEGSVHFWIETATGNEMAMVHATDYRAVMNERDRLRHETTDLQRTVDMQQPLVTATADVVEAAREVLEWPREKYLAKLNHALAALDTEATHD